MFAAFSHVSQYKNPVGITRENPVKCKKRKSTKTQLLFKAQQYHKS